MPLTERHWYIVWTKPREERRASEHLHNQGFEVFLPFTWGRRRRAGHHAAAVVPLFPRYLFLRADANIQSLAAVRSSRGCCDVVRLGGSPAVVPDAVVNGLMQRQGDDGTVCAEPAWQPGQALEVREGPFEGLQAIFQAASSRERVQVLLHCLGQWQRTTILRAHVETSH